MQRPAQLQSKLADGDFFRSLLEEINGQVKLTMTHDGFDDGSEVFPKIQMGWPSILSSLKSLLETGKELPPFWRGDYDKK